MHTTGPWISSAGMIVSKADHKAIAGIAGTNPNRDANARLIAAAPDLLTVATAITRRLPLLVDVDDPRNAGFAALVEQASAAIAKAKGEQA